MNERYSRLFSVRAPLYAKGAPVIIEAGALLEDTYSKTIILQLKFSSVSKKRIKAVKLGARLYNTAGEELDELPEVWYLDLNAMQGQSFGQKKPVPVKSKLVRRYEPFVSEVIFEDGTKWLADGEEWFVLPERKKLSYQLREELIAQYRELVGENSIYIPEQTGELWLCSCGAYNRIDGEEKVCAVCHRRLDAELAALDTEPLRAMASKKEKQKKKSITLIASFAAVALILFLTVFPNAAEKQAVQGFLDFEEYVFMDGVGSVDGINGVELKYKPAKNEVVFLLCYDWPYDILIQGSDAFADNLKENAEGVKSSYLRYKNEYDYITNAVGFDRMGKRAPDDVTVVFGIKSNDGKVVTTQRSDG